MFPEMVKTNARYRGPMESKKMTDSVLDVEASLRRVADLLRKNKENGSRLFNEMASTYNVDMYKAIEVKTHQIQSIKGGEL